MKIGIDVDGVLADHYTPFCNHVRKQSNSNLDPRNLPTWDVQLPGSSKTILESIDDLLSDPQYIRQLPVVDGARKGMKRLCDSPHEIIIVTSRDARLHSVTADWLDRNGINYDGFAFKVPENKGHLRIGVLLDDYHGYVRDAWDAGVHSVLFRQPWNKFYSANFPPQRVVRSWDEAVDCILDEIESETPSNAVSN